MPSDKRQRQDEGRLSRLEQQQADRRRSQRRKQARSLGLLLGALLVVAAAIAFFSGDDDDAVVSSDGTTTTTPGDETTTTAGDDVEIVLPGAGASITGETPCPAADGSAERTTSFEQAPPTCIEEGITYTAMIATSEGNILVELDAEAAPQTVNNFVVLARYHFYDDLPFHRIIPGFMNQAGDPVGPQPGTGGPGYTIPDELPTGDAPYPAGTLAMANKSQPNTGGAQWFITVEGGGEQLTPDYAAFGRVIEGQEVVDAINAFGDAATNGTPTKIVTIETITISEA